MMLKLKLRGDCTMLVDDENIIYDIGDVKSKSIPHRMCGHHSFLGSLYLPGVDFNHLDMSYSNMHNATFTYADLRGTNLEGANLEGANLEYCLFDEDTVFPQNYRIHQKTWDGKISEATTEVRDLDGKVLFMVNSKSLVACHLSNLDLRKADFRGQCLRDVSFLGSLLDEADFSGADLKGSGIYWNDYRKDRFVYDDKTQFDRHHQRHWPSYM